MKKVIFTFSILGALAFNSFGQACGTTSTCSANQPTGTPGLSPESADLPCVLTGQAVNQVIQFENYDQQSFNGISFRIQTLKIDSIENLPSGLCWSTNKANNTFAGAETGCISVTGTTNAPLGQYKLKIIVSVTTNSPLVPSINKLDAESVLQLRYYVRVNTSGTSEFGIDTTAGKTNAFIAKASLPAGSCTPNGINDINNNISKLTIKPNPMTNAAVMSFESTVNDNAVVTMTDLLGNVISRKNADIVIGNNDITIERNNAAAGVYFVTISSKNGKVSHKLVID